jgi:hypothetical protein
MFREWSEIQKTDVDCGACVCIFFACAELIEAAAEIGKGTFGPVVFVVDLHFQIDGGIVVHSDIDIKNGES